MTAKIKAEKVTRTGSGDDINLRSVLSGEIGVADYFFIQALKGNMYYIGSVDVTTPTTWTATGTVDVTKAILHVDVPSNKALIPVHLELYMEAFGTSAQFEVSAATGKGGSRTSGMTAITPINLRSDLSDNSGVTAWAGDNTAVTVGITTNKNTFWRDGKQFAITKTAESATVSSFDPVKFAWDAVLTNTFPIVAPDGELQVYQGSQAGTGFIKLIACIIDASELP